ncbi:MAG TPA: histidine kinase [Opitutaceae bacterium]|nr:histidine kinase [Opitutaceae bacterium]
MSPLSRQPLLVVFSWILAAFLAAFGPSSRAAEADEPPAPVSDVITSAAQALALTSVEARAHHPIRLRGVVTVAEKDWAGQFFVQDASAGIFVVRSGPEPEVGDILEVTGVSDTGGFAPIVQRGEWKKLGHTDVLPVAAEVPIEELMAGSHDSLRVQIKGVIRAVRLQGNRFIVDVAVSGFRLPVISPLPGHDLESLIGRRVTVRGTAAASFQITLRHITNVNIFVPRLNDFVLDSDVPPDPFYEPTIPIRQVAEYRRDASPERRIHVRAVVTLNQGGSKVFVQDETGALQIHGTRLEQFSLGDTVDAVGFLEFHDYLPLLNDVIVRRSTMPMTLPAVAQVPSRELIDGLHPGELIKLNGRVQSVIQRRAHHENGNDTGVVTTWEISNGEMPFTAEVEGPEDEETAAMFPVGSVVQVSGVLNSDSTDEGHARHVRLLLPSPRSIQMLQAPSWFTPEHLAVSLAVVVIAALIVSIWTVGLSRKNAGLRLAIEARDKAQEALRETHELLERRVQERTEQLRFEMTARKTAEVQFKAVLTERTRLAQELHDTLEQTLVGISLQLDAASRMWHLGASEVKKHLEIAQAWIRQSQTELRRSIWDLRSRAMQEFDLAKALARNGEQIAGGAGIQTSMTTSGEARQLPEIVEENLLRIGQEALTNVVKHSGATKVFLHLAFLPGSVSLEIKDNGLGLAKRNGEALAERNHFGLVGMSERAARMSGRLEITGQPGEGVTVRVEVPLKENPA